VRLAAAGVFVWPASLDQLLPTTVERSSRTLQLRIRDLRSAAKDGGHQPRIAAPVENRHNPQRLLVGCVGDEVPTARDMES
jgi:hypothetical protein